MAFDPDKYLAAKKGGFDPDAYLASKKGTVTPTIKMKNPEGQLEDINPDNIGEYIKKGYEYDDTEIRKKVMSDRAAKTSMGESAVAGGAQGASMGAADEIAGGLGAVKDLLHGDTDVIDNYRKNRDNARYMDDVAQMANPKTFMAANMAGAIGSGVIGAGALAKSGVDGVRAATMLGGLDAAGQSEADLTKGEVRKFANDVGKGAALGGSLQVGSDVIAESLSPAMKYIKDKLAGKAEERAVKALDPILSQQEMLNRKDTAGKLGRSLLDEDVVQFGSSTKDMLPRVEGMLSKKGARIGEIRDEVQRAGHGVDLSSLKEKGIVDNLAANSGGIQSKADETAAYLNDVTRLNDGGLYGPIRTIDEIQDVIKDLSKKLDFNKAVIDTTPDKHAAMTLRGDLVGKVDEAIKGYDPKLLAEHQGLKDQYALFKDSEKILDKSVARHARNKDFGLSDLLVANLPRGNSVAQDGLLKTAAAIGHKLARERGNATLAVTLDTLSRQPERFGKFAGKLLEAAKRGEAAVTATHFILMKDPEYKAIVEEQ